jgi:hypothetical protein
VIPVPQTKRGGAGLPPEERGDCVPAALASLLEVPIDRVRIAHADDGFDAWWLRVHDALRPFGLYLLHHPAEWPAPPGYWIAGVPSLNLLENGEPMGHVIVMHGTNVAHDPALGRRYDRGPLPESAEVQERWVLVPYDPTAGASQDTEQAS